MNTEKFMQENLLNIAIQNMADKMQKPSNEILKKVLLTETYKLLLNLETKLYTESPACLQYLLEAELSGDTEALKIYWEAE